MFSLSLTDTTPTCFHFSALPWRISKSFPQDFKFMAGKLKRRDILKTICPKLRGSTSVREIKTPGTNWPRLPWQQCPCAYVYKYLCMYFSHRKKSYQLGDMNPIESVSSVYDIRGEKYQFPCHWEVEPSVGIRFWYDSCEPRPRTHRISSLTRLPPDPRRNVFAVTFGVKAASLCSALWLQQLARLS